MQNFTKEQIDNIIEKALENTSKEVAKLLATNVVEIENKLQNEEKQYCRELAILTTALQSNATFLQEVLYELAE